LLGISYRLDDLLVVVVPPATPKTKGNGHEGSGMKTTQESKPYSIAIADDDTSCRQALREIMEPEGFRTLLASSGEEVIDIIRDAPVHLVVLDMYMPTLTGLDTLMMIRQLHPRLPAILVTGDPSESVVRQALQQHVYSVLPKPLSKNLVLYTVIQALSRFYGLVGEARGGHPQSGNVSP
jgi:DNA-binding NtrC family response regulator